MSQYTVQMMMAYQEGREYDLIHARRHGRPARPPIDIHTTLIKRVNQWLQTVRESLARPQVLPMECILYQANC